MRKTLIKILVLIGAINLGGCYETRVKHFTTLTLNNPDIVNYNEISYREGRVRMKITEEVRNMKFVFRDQINPKALAITPEKTTQQNASKKNNSTTTDSALDWYNYNIELLFEDAFVITADFGMVSPLVPLPPIIPTKISNNEKLECSVKDTSTLIVVQEGNRNNRQYYRTDLKLLDKGFGEWILFKPGDFYLIDEKCKY